MIPTHLSSRTEMAVVDKGGGVVEMVPGDEDEEVGNGRNTNHLSSHSLFEYLLL